jgi:hypothetical protein
MKNVLLLSSLLSVVGISCKDSTVEPPVQPLSIEGTYQAKYYDSRASYNNVLFYPINGQELTLQIKYVATDTVSVEIKPSSNSSSLPDGVYSPNQTLVYPKAYVDLSNTGSTYIYLSGKKEAQVSVTNPQIWMYKNTKNADYFFAPQQTPNHPSGIRFEKN